MTLIKKVIVLLSCAVCFGCHNQGEEALRFTIPKDYTGLVIIGFDKSFQNDSCQISESGILLRSEHSIQNGDLTIGYNDEKGRFVRICDMKDLSKNEQCANDKYLVAEVNSNFSLNLCYYLNIDKSNNSDTCFLNIENLKYLVISSNKDSIVGEDILSEADKKLTNYIISNFK